MICTSLVSSSSPLSRDYHAVVECDSVTTANYIHEDINGYEVFSTIPLDLRFIPDNIEFKNPPRDVATEVFDIYKF